MCEKILLAEDDNVQRDIITDILLKNGYDVNGVRSGEAAINALKAEDYAMLLTDLRMVGIDGLELLRQAKRLRPDIEVVVMTAYATVKTAVTAMKEGATDYLAKPFDKDDLLLTVERTLERAQLRRQNQHLRELVREETSLGNIVGQSGPMQAMFDRIRRAIPLTTTVLLLGESGTGKEMVARHIHFNGPRKAMPFIVVNCAAIPDTLIESELFGHEKGAFTGAETARPGKFEVANRGTIFLDEIGDMQLDAQAKLLRVLQDGRVERVGSTEGREVDVRVIAATNRDLKERVTAREFREDLYFRLDVLPIYLPSLRERIEDLALLINHFREKLGKKLGKPAPTLGPDALEAFRRYRWPGNVRELENALEQLYILTDSPVIGVEDLPEKLRHRSEQPVSFQLSPGGVVLEDIEQDLIRQALERSGGRIKEAAELLGLTYKTLQYRLKKHQIDRKDM